MQIRFFSLIGALTLLLTTSAAMTAPPLAPTAQGSASEVIALINDYRAQNGLPAYQQNSTLAAIAQGQADWLASQPMGSVSDVHAGPDGSRPRDRAYAAGYGGGQTIFISEIVKGGYQESAADALAWWKTSAPHNNTMLASTYVEIGAGVATDGTDRWWYVAVTGYIVGGSYPTGVPPVTGTQQAAAPVMIPVTKAEPRPDGSVVHIIRTGQTLWTLSAVYEVPLDQIRALNGFTTGVDGSVSYIIHPGDEIIVKPPGSEPTLVPTKDANITPTFTPVPTSTPLPTLRPTAQQLAAAETSPGSPLGQTSQLTSEAKAQAANTSVMLVVGVALLSILGVFVASFFIQRPQAPETSEPDPFAPIE